MIVILGESGSGKSTVESVLSRDFGYRKVVSFTTREKRDGEVDGVDYRFIPKSKFEDMICEGKLDEYVNYNGMYYGSRRPTQEDMIELGYDPTKLVAVLTPHGYRQYVRKYGDKIFGVRIWVDETSRAINSLKRGTSLETVYLRAQKDIGYFDGITDEVNVSLENPRYTFTAYEIAKVIDEHYREYLEKYGVIACEDSIPSLCSTEGNGALEDPIY